MTDVAAIARWCAAQEQQLRDSAPDVPFSQEEYLARAERLRAAMFAAELDVLILTAPDAMCWLTGYDSRWYRSHSSTEMPPAQCVLVHLDTDVIIHVETAAHEQLVRLTSVADEYLPVPGSRFDHEPTLREFVDCIVNEFARRGWKRSRAGVERWSSVPNPAALDALERGLDAAGHRVRDATHLIRAARRVKSASEIAMIERAQAACDAGLRHLHQSIRPGMTELEAWSVYMAGLVDAGGEPTAMHETVAGGVAMPSLHRPSSRRTIKADEYVLADVAGAVHRYHARCTRMLWLGTAPAEVRALTEIIAGAHDVVTSTARIGMRFSELAGALAGYFKDCGMPGWAGGYELGVSFPPDWVGEFTWSTAMAGESVIEAGLVTNFESCAGTTAMVDTVVFEQAGARLLSSLPREVLEAAP